MREIKFRGYDGADWIYGMTVNNEFGNGCSNWRMIKCDGELDGWINVINVGQYTGLKDMNGTEIYEGDLLDSTRWIVTYVDSSNGANLGLPVGWYEQRDNFESYRQLEVGDIVEVVGNIYEDPELIR